jgi:hypothetical protein
MPQPRREDAGTAVACVDTDALYSLPLEQFVRERDQLARRLRRERRPEDAVLVAKLRKPSLPAWASNRALRSQPVAARELRAAGSALADAQRDVLCERASPGQLRDAIKRHRAALDPLVAAARGLVDGNGRALSPATLERVGRTLVAASLDPALAQEAETARLEREHFFTGLDELAPAHDVDHVRPKPVRSGRGQHANTSLATAARERREREMTRRRRAARIKAARSRLTETRKRTATTAKARDAAARAAKKADAEHRRAERRHAQALDAQATAQAHLEALLRDEDEYRTPDTLAQRGEQK